MIFGGVKTMAIKNQTLLVSIVVLLCGCAAKPESIAPSYVSPVGYLNWDCEQLAGEQGRLVASLATASDAQRQARSNDTVGVIFLGLPVSSLSGSNQASNIARLKGELEALQKAIIEKKCGTEIIPVDKAIEKKD